MLNVLKGCGNVSTNSSYLQSALQLIYSLFKTYFMLPDKIMQSDLLDIIFENRNKAYGAYTLRKSYNRTLAVAITITLFIAMIFSIVQFMHFEKHHDYVTPFIIPPDQELIKINEVKPQPENPALQHSATHFNQKIYTSPVIVKDLPETQTPTIEDIDKSIIGKMNIDGKDAMGEIQPTSNTIEGTANNIAAPVETKKDNSPLTWAQVMPEYPGGIEALRKFMLRNLKQPDDLQPGEKIIVKAFFVVSIAGRIEQIKILNEGRNDLNKEVERVINKMPLWKPGMQNGTAVAVYFNLPVTFMSEE